MALSLLETSSSRYWYLSFFLALHSLALCRLRSSLAFRSIFAGLRPRLPGFFTLPAIIWQQRYLSICKFLSSNMNTIITAGHKDWNILEGIIQLIKVKKAACLTERELHSNRPEICCCVFLLNSMANCQLANTVNHYQNTGNTNWETGS